MTFMRGVALISATVAAAAAVHSEASARATAPSDIPYPCIEALLHFCAGTSGAGQLHDLRR